MSHVRNPTNLRWHWDLRPESRSIRPFLDCPSFCQKQGSRSLARRPAGHVIVDGPPRALDGVAQSGHELY